MLRTFDEVLNKAKDYGPKKMAVASAGAEDVLKAVEAARKEGLTDSILVGDKKEIIQIAEKMGINPANYEIIDKPDKTETARCAVELVRNKKASILMKGMMGTARLLQAVLDKEIGLRTNRMLSHAYVLEVKGYDRIITITDGAMNIKPDLNQKAQIIQNAIYFYHALGIEKPKVAALAAVELVNPDMPATIDAACLAKMSERGQIIGGIVDGPLAFDNAISKKAALHKGIESPVSGEVDILLAPDIEAANIFAKGLVYLAKAVPAGLLLGAKAPVVLVSRSDSAESKLYSIALGVLMSEMGEL
ncbi:MAG: phosphate butyryltransferase [bacterium]|nr:phosphate butyryltransferase [bacterium]MBU1291142.1 phosphate butyryltransferase [bacterium]MBU1427747.1 phosphate butyryltransferase [bacterium]MBU2440506.1 phosphate butyryltransferase [bacterium]